MNLYTLQGEDGSRRMRIWNVCVAILDNESKWLGKEVSTRRIRSYIRKKLKMGEPKSQAGDLRGTGDAVGGHGLHLRRRELVKNKIRHNLVTIDKETIEKVRSYLRPESNDILL